MEDRDILVPSTRIKVIGVGGAGNNTVDRIRLEMEVMNGLELCCVNTDMRTLADSPVGDQHLLGRNLTRGLGCGGDPQLGRKAARSDSESITRMVEGYELIFLVSSLGGGTGAGASPIIAQIARKCGCLIIAFVNMPFTFEGERRFKQANQSLKELREVCDAVIPLPNDVLLQEEAAQESVLHAFSKADEWITRGVRSIWAMLSKPGLINLDFSSLREVFNVHGGKTLFGVGSGSGPDFMRDALNDLMHCPLLHVPDFSKVADNLLVNIVGGTDLSMAQVEQVMAYITEQFGSRASTTLGAVIDEGKQQSIEICVIGTTDLGGLRPLRTNRPASSVPAKDRTGLVLDSASSGLNTSAGGRNPDRLDPSTSVQQDLGIEVSDGNRGYFEETGPNELGGQDLDVPTYLRRGIRVVLT